MPSPPDITAGKSTQGHKAIHHPLRLRHRDTERNERRDRMKARKSFVVGIAGGSASGKTTFTQTLVKVLTEAERLVKVEVMGMGRYFYRGGPDGPTFVSPTTGETLPHNNHPDSADNARLVADLEARVTAEDAPDILIVEGLM